MLLGFFILSLCLGTGCSDATKAKFDAWSGRHRVTLYSGGTTVGVWISTGKIENEPHSDGYYFKDDASGRLVRISGTVIIELLEPKK